MYQDYQNYKLSKNEDSDREQKIWYHRFVFEVFPEIVISIIEIFDQISMTSLPWRTESMALDEQDLIVTLPEPKRGRDRGGEREREREICSSINNFNNDLKIFFREIDRKAFE